MSKTTRLRTVTFFTIAPVMLLAATCAVAQQAPDRANFYLQDIRGAIERLESFAPHSLEGDALTPSRPDLQQLSVGTDTINLRRNFTRSMVDIANQPLGVGFMENTVTEAALNLSSSTAMRFSSTETHTTDIRGFALNTTRVDVMGLNQSFGQGEGASTLALSRTVTANTVGDTTSHVKQDVLDFHSGLGKTTDFAFHAGRLRSDVPNALQQTDFLGTLKLTFSGGEAPWSYGRTHQYNNAVDIETERMDFAIPLALHGQVALAEYHSSVTNTNGVETVNSRTTHFALPLRVFGQLGTFDTLSAITTTNGVDSGTRNTTLKLPVLRLAGQAGSFDYVSAMTVANGLETGTANTHFVMPIRLIGQTGTFDYLSATTLTNGVENGAETTRFVIPLRLAGQTGSFDHVNARTVTNGVGVDAVTTRFAMPLRVGSQAWNFEHLIQGQDAGAGMLDSLTTKLVSPFRIGSRQFGLEEWMVSAEQPGGGRSDTLAAKLTAPLAGGQATIQHQTVTTEASGATSEVQQLYVALPSIKIGQRMSFSGQRVSTDTVGSSSLDVTNVNMTADPLKPLHIEAQYQITEPSTAETTVNQALYARWMLNERMALTGRLTEAELGGGAVNGQRLLELVRDRGDSAYGVRAALVSYDIPGTQVENARRIEVDTGNPKGVLVKAAYSEFDPASYARLPKEALVAVELRHGDPAAFEVKYRFEDQATRVEPLQAVNVAMQALGGTLTLGYQANPLAPDLASVRQGDQYDAKLARKIFGHVNLEVGYRYVDYDESIGEAQNFDVRLNGGKVERGGEISLRYSTGDLTRDPTTAVGTLLPGSLLSLKYSRKWGDAGRLQLSLSRQTPITEHLGTETTEGHLEYSQVF